MISYISITLDHWHADSSMISWAGTHPHTLRKRLYTIFFRDLKLCLGNPGLFSWILGYWSVLASPQAFGWDCSTPSHSLSLPTPFLSLKTRGHFNDHKGLIVLWPGECSPAVVGDWGVWWHPGLCCLTLGHTGPKSYQAGFQSSYSSTNPRALNLSYSIFLSTQWWEASLRLPGSLQATPRYTYFCRY